TKSAIASADIITTAEAKKLRSKYFNERNGRSIQRGMRKFRPNNRRPIFHRYSDRVPTGHIQLQKDFLNKKEIEANAKNKKNAAGCSRGNCPLASTYLNCIRPSIGSQPSTPEGRETGIVWPPVSAHRTQR